MVLGGLLLMSLLLNVVFFLTLLRRTGSGVAKHVHTWTPWTDFRTFEPPPFAYPGAVVFRRVRYCSGCGEEQKQEVGAHNCEPVSIKGKRCPHREDYTAIFDPLYELTQMDKELKRLEGM